MKNNILYTPQDYLESRMPRRRRGLIIHTGALGDGILTLRLGGLLKKHLGINWLEFIGNKDYIDLYPGRTCVNKIISQESIQLNRLFAPTEDFTIAEDDKIASDFSGYEWVISFLGEKGGNFEQNLIVTLYHSFSSEVVTLSPKAPDAYNGHISQFHLDEFIHEKRGNIEAFCDIEDLHLDLNKQFIHPDTQDEQLGHKILQPFGVDEKAEKLALVAPGSGSTKKTWHLDNFLALSQKMTAKGLNLAFVLGPAEIERFSDTDINKLKSVGPVIQTLDITKLCAIVSVCDLFIGNDSGPSHLSAGMGKKTFTIFGPSNMKRYCPTGPYAYKIKEPTSAFAGFNPASIDRVCDFIEKNDKFCFPTWDFVI